MESGAAGTRKVDIPVSRDSLCSRMGKQLLNLALVGALKHLQTFLFLSKDKRAQETITQLLLCQHQK